MTQKKESGEERENKGSLKRTRHEKLKTNGKPKRHMSGALNPQIRTCHLVTTCTA